MDVWNAMQINPLPTRPSIDLIETGASVTKSSHTGMEPATGEQFCGYGWR